MSLVSDRRRLWKEMTVQEHLRVGAYRRAARRGWRRRATSLQEALPGSLRETRGATRAAERRPPAAARAGPVRDVVPARLASRRSSSGPRRVGVGARSRMDTGFGRRGRRRGPDGPARSGAPRRRDEGDVSRREPPLPDPRRRRRPAGPARPPAALILPRRRVV